MSAPAMPRARRAPASGRLDRESGYTLVELVVVVAIVGIMSALAVGGFGDMIRRQHDQLTMSSLQSARVGLAGYVVAQGSIPKDQYGAPLALGAAAVDSAGHTIAQSSGTVSLPGDDASFRAGYVVGCFQTLSATTASDNNKWLHNGLCTTSDKAENSTTHAKPLLEVDFVLCGQYGASGQVYVGDTWHAIQAAPSGTSVSGSGAITLPAGAKWPDGTAMSLHGCTLTPITSTGGVVPALLTGS